MYVFLPIRSSDYEPLYKKYQSLISEINSLKDFQKLSQLSISDNKELRRFHSVEIRVNQASEKKVLEKWLQFTPNNFGWEQKYAFEIPPDCDMLGIKLKTPQEDYFYSVVRDFNKDFNWLIISDIQDVLNRLMLILNIASNSMVDFLEGSAYFDNGFHIGKTTTYISNMEFVYGHSYGLNWPIIPDITLSQVVEWFSENMHPYELSTNSVQRGINSFSYSFYKPGQLESSNLFWMMLGIEAILCEGKSEIQKQISMKLSLIFDTPPNFKKKINQLYNYRSRLIHGDLNLTGKFSYDRNELTEEYNNYLYFATSILISLIKDLIQKNKTKYEFEIILKD
ncbi:hypothetical protein EJ994_01325 [Maribacter sp. MJ134]|uniref:HEPN domain-containing protein n=1 Tax=Maribacter sp. MJ134 TaxID=2496865 RepID=UPI000F84ABD0|nr:HEPN domain-containing protein [Maribacter sp. MJ134]AZQ57514.1 hypothetical protein EJ994_01325 [Maribacter sp. MJ134]